MPETLSELLLNTRLKLRLSLSQISETSGVDTTTIWRIEQGITDPRCASQLFPLVVALGIPVKTLMRSLNQQPNPKGTNDER